MHIPDGYLSLATCAIGYAIDIPLWIIGLRKIKSILNEKTLPLLASLTAFSFIVMMFNIPLPGGTSGHATGDALLSIVFGPWIAFICMSLVLFIQAVVFGDGGITTYGINTFAMGCIASFSSYWIFQLLKNSKLSKFAPFIAGWFSLVMASLFIGFILGIQPYLAHTSDGKPIYFPFGLEISIPAMIIPHMLVFGVAEGIFTQIAYEFIVKKEYLLNEKEITQ
ncbi:cobalt transporter CbiM [Hydrogenothermus marinus]|uniref:Cobalt/nickel transport system permease protein n=1 Tax=Hydrogenothermus marinus TaxID=133270 RepID=A0A3M0BNI3_9AQUI|nr:cobalt transporter CbiM [Hydrogenothermus marinus]RMA97849.1 cobalt/nickel transport system permease protein [Hydrogenothermus marinus]